MNRKQRKAAEKKRGKGMAPAVGQSLQLALQCHQTGRLAEAERLYRQVLATDEKQPDALHYLGILHHQTGRSGEAARLIGEALKIRPDDANIHNNLGTVHLDNKEYDDAVDAFTKAIRHAPNMVQAHYNLGCAHLEAGRTEAAEAALRTAVGLDPRHAGAHNNLGNALTDLGALEEAIDHFRTAMTLAPNQAETYNNLGIALHRSGRPDEAETAYRKAVALTPGNGETWYNLGSVLTERNKLSEAVQAFEKGRSLRPDILEITNQLLYQLRKQCRWNQQESLETELLRRIDGGETDITPFPLLAGHATPAHQLAAARGHTIKRFSRLDTVRGGLGFTHARKDKAKLTIGYLSYNFRECASGFLLPDLFETHDRQKFTIAGYSYSPDDGSAQRRRMIAACDRFEDIQHLSFVEAARKIYADGVDILVDMKGYTQSSRSEIAALRPAPVQAAYLGYSGTMGADFIDYLLVDRFVVPEGYERYFSEKLVFLPHRYFPTDAKREIADWHPARGECGLPETGFVFCSFSNSYKIGPEVFDVWMDLLKAVPGSVLWLLEWDPGVPDNLRREAEKRGVNPDRLVFAPKRPNAEYLAQYRIADLVLDTPYCNGHTTITDCLWAGAPAISLPGETLAGRVAGALLIAMGLPELVADSLDGYRDLALALAQNPKKLAAYRKRIADHLPGGALATAPLFDTPRFTRAMEAGYRAMWERFVTGDGPAEIHIPEQE